MIRAACVFITGILLAEQGGLFPLALLAGIWIWTTGEDLLRRRYDRAIVSTALLMLVLFISIFHMHSVQTEHDRCLPLPAEGETVRAIGTLTAKEYKNEKYRYYFTDCLLQKANGEQCSCRRLLVFSDTDEELIGNVYEIEGRVYRFAGASNEGMFDLAAYYAMQQLDFALTKPAFRLRRSAAFHLRESLYRLRQRLCTVVEAYMEESEAGVMNSILFGDKSLLGQETKSLYQDAGISHILAVSGLHVSMVGMVLYRILRKLGGGFLFSGILAGGLLICYYFFSGGSVSAKRAVGMLLLTMAGQLLGRRTDMTNSLGAVVILILWENPYLLGYAGFLFSVMAILGIAVPGVILDRYCTKETDKPKRVALIPGLAIQLTSLPITLFFYYEFPLYSILLNMLVLPLTGVLFAFGMAGSLSGWLLGGGSTLAGLLPGFLFLPAHLILTFFQWVGSLALTLPSAKVITGQPGKFRLGVYYFCLCTLLLFLWRKAEQRRALRNGGEEKPGHGSRRMLAAVGLLLVILLVPGKRSFEIDVLDVGQGDGIYLCTEDGVSFMIDGGSVSETEVGTYRLLPFLKSKGIAEIEYWFISHGDQDHISGLLEALQSGYRVKNIVLSKEMPKDDAWEELAEAAKKAGCGIRYMEAGDTIRTETAAITCVYPWEGLETRYSDRNDLCLTLLYEEAGFRALFAGDLSEAAEKTLIRENPIGTVDFLKVCHHGSRYSSSEEFLEHLKPENAAISCARINSFGHPAREAVKRLEEMGIRVWYTMKGGQIKLLRSEEGITLREFIEVQW